MPDLDSNPIYNAISKSDTNKGPSPSTLILYFLFITTIYAVLNVYKIINIKIADMNSQSLEDKIKELFNNKNSAIYTLIYIGLLFMGTYFINITISKSICSSNSTAWFEVFALTLLPWISIFGIIYLLLEIYPGWIKPFSNTIGYVLVNSIGAETQLNKVLLETPSQDTTSSASTSNGGNLVLAIANINKDKAKFINQFDNDPQEFYKFITQLKSSRLFKDNDNTIMELYKHILIKDEIGKIIWYILAGTIISSVTYNFIINITCQNTYEESSDYFNALYNSEKTKKTGRKWKKITETNNRVNASDTDYYTNLINEHGRRFNLNDEVLFTREELRRARIPLEIKSADSIYIEFNGRRFIPME